MKRYAVLFILLLVVTSGCRKEDDTVPRNQIREIAWNSHSEQDQSSVTVNWYEAPVNNDSYQAKSVYAERFNTSNDSLLGPIIVYIDKNSLLVLGKGPRY